VQGFVTECPEPEAFSYESRAPSYLTADVRGAGSRVQGPGFRVRGPGFRVQGSGSRVQGPGFRVQGSGSGVQGPGFRVQGPGSRVQGFATEPPEPEVFSPPPPNREGLGISGVTLLDLDVEESPWNTRHSRTPIDRQRTRNLMSLSFSLERLVTYCLLLASPSRLSLEGGIFGVEGEGAASLEMN
jgi:hypothetical protein